MKNYLNVVKWDDNTINRKLEINVFQKDVFVKEQSPSKKHTHKYCFFGEKTYETIKYNKNYNISMDINIAKISWNEFYCNLSFTLFNKTLQHQWFGIYGNHKYKPKWSTDNLKELKRKCKFISYRDLENYVNKYIESEVIPYVESIIK